MSSNDGEAENLRKQIQYLESLISKAKVNKSREKVPAGRVPVGVSNKVVYPVPNKEHTHHSGQGHVTADSRKYSWKRVHSEKQYQHYNSIHGNSNRNRSPYFSNASYKKDDGRTFVKDPRGNNEKRPFNNVKNECQKRTDKPDDYGARHVVSNVPDILCLSSLTNSSTKLSGQKSKSLFTWNRYPQSKNSDVISHSKGSQFEGTVPKSEIITDCTRSKSICSNDCSKHLSSEIPKLSKSGHSVDNHQTCSSTSTKSESAIFHDTKVTTSVTSKKHLALQTHLLEAQTKLEEWKRTLLEKNKMSQGLAISTRGGYSRGINPRFFKAVKHSRQRPINRYQHFTKSSRNMTRPWQSYWGWRSKYNHRIIHDTFFRGGRYSYQGNRGKQRHRFHADYMYYDPKYGYPAKRTSKHINYYSKRHTGHGYKFGQQQVISKAYVKRQIQRLKGLKEKVPFDPKMKLDRRKQEGNSKELRFVVINGMLYKTTQKSLVRASEKQRMPSSSKPRSSSVVTGPILMGTGAHSRIKFLSTTAMKTVVVRGMKFKVDRDGRNLKRMDLQPKDGAGAGPQYKGASCVSRVDIGGVTYRQTEPGTLERVTTRKTRVIAARVLNRSMAHVATKHKKDNRKSPKQPKFCMFYNRFGKCNRQQKCPFVHDPDRIAVCTRFLRGTCKEKLCPFSHKVSVEKMPVCSYFLKGMCNKTDCPYPHVNVNKNAEICQDFVNGFCELGQKCTKKHTLLCPVFVKMGACPQGKKCQLQHRKPKPRKRSSNSQTVNLTSERNQSKVLEAEQKPAILDDCDSNIPFKERRLPAYISLSSKDTEHLNQPTSGAEASNIQTEESKSLKIRPQL